MSAQFETPTGSPKDAKAQGKAEKAYRKAQRPFYKKKRFILPALFVLLVVIISVAASGGSKSSKTPSQAGATAPGATNQTKNSQPLQHTEDAKITSCAKDATLGYPTAKVRLTNRSSKPSNYVVEVAFESPNGKTQIDTAMVAVNTLAPGQTTVQTGSALTEATGAFKCVIKDVTRYAS